RSCAGTPGLRSSRQLARCRSPLPARLLHERLRTRPVPPVTVTFACKKLEGAPGGLEAPPQPVAMMVPTCVPSTCLMSKTQSKKNEAPLSAIASPGDKVVPETTECHAPSRYPWRVFH